MFYNFPRGAHVCQGQILETAMDGVGTFATVKLLEEASLLIWPMKKKITWMWASKTVEHATLEYWADQCRLESFQIALQKYCKSTHMHSDLANRDAAKRNCKIDLAPMGFQNSASSLIGPFPLGLWERNLAGIGLKTFLCAHERCWFSVHYLFVWMINRK